MYAQNDWQNTEKRECANYEEGEKSNEYSSARTATEHDGYRNQTSYCDKIFLSQIFEIFLR